MLTKYDTNFFTKNKKAHSVVLSSVHLRFASLQSVRWKKRLAVIGISTQRKGVNRLANSQQNGWFENAMKVESPPMEQTSLIL